MAINIAIMGFGTVGSGVAETLDINKDVIAKRVGEEINVLESSLHRLHAAHRKTGDGAVILVGKHAVVAFDEGDDVGDHILGKWSHLVLHIRSSDGTVGHPHNHRLDLALSQKVVEDVACSSRIGPTRIGVAPSMNQVKHGKLF